MVYKPANATYWYASIPVGDGRWRYKSTKRRTKAEAQRVEAQWRTQSLNQAQFPQARAATITYGAFQREYLQHRQATRARETVRLDTRALTELAAIVGYETPVHHITVGLCQRYVSACADRVAPATVRKRMRHLKHALAYAVEQGYLLRNPVSHVELPKVEPTKRAIPPADVQALLDATHWRWIGTYIRAGVFQGLRSSEIRGIRHSDIDWTQALVTVTGKTGQRLVPIFPSFATVLRTLPPDADGYVFPQYRTQTISKRFKATVRTLWPADPRRDQYRFHDTRHTFATQYLRQGGQVEKLRKLLGHTDIRTTVQYEHLTPTDLREAEGQDPVRYG